MCYLPPVTYCFMSSYLLIKTEWKDTLGNELNPNLMYKNWILYWLDCWCMEPTIQIATNYHDLTQIPIFIAMLSMIRETLF